MMKHIHSIILVLAIAISTLVACDGKKPFPSKSIAIDDLTVTDQRKLSLDDPKSIALSPNGKWLSVNWGGEICIHATDTLAQENCIALENHLTIEPFSTAWSPDSEKIVFNDHPSIDFESDLFVFHVASGKRIQLTQDREIDRLPVWSPDGDAIAFIRSSETDLGIYTLPAKGGTPEILVPGIYPESMVWSPDGRIFFTTQQGLWAVSEKKPNPQTILERDPEMGQPWLVEISPDGDKSLVFYRLAAARDFFSKPNTSYAAIVDLNSGNVTPLLPATGDEVEFTGPMVAAFSPDGMKILYIYRDSNDQIRLIARDLGSGKEKSLLILDVEKPDIFVRAGHSLTWSSNDTVLLPLSQLLLTLGSE